MTPACTTDFVGTWRHGDKRVAGAVVRLSRQRDGAAGRVHRGAGARRGGAAGFGTRALAAVRHRRAAPDAGPVRRRLPRAACGHRRRRPVRHDRLGSHRAAVHVALPDARDRGGRARRRSRCRRADYQPGPAPHRLPRLARRALAGFPGLANRVLARSIGRYRSADLVDRSRRVGLRDRDGHRRARPPAGPVPSRGDAALPELRSEERATREVRAAWPRGSDRETLLPAGRGDGPVSLAAHLIRYGALPCFRGRAQRDAMIAEVEAAGLTGRGGAAFPTARKLAAAAGGRRPVVVGNGTEGEPASAKDKALMARSPQLVLDGAVVAAELTGAAEAVIVAHRDVREIIDQAAAERRGAGFDQVRISVRIASDRFAGGESSAVVHWLKRGVPAPTGRPARQAGPYGAPALVQNVETLGHLALIARYGATWFRSVGTSAEPGSMLVTILGAVRMPCVTEIAIGTPVGHILDLAGGPSAPLRALLLGGYSGAWVPAAEAMGRPFSARGLEDLGATPGAGLIVALPATACGLRETARVIRYLASE